MTPKNVSLFLCLHRHRRLLQTSLSLFLSLHASVVHATSDTDSSREGSGAPSHMHAEGALRETVFKKENILSIYSKTS